MSNVNKVKLLSERTSGVPPIIFSFFFIDHLYGWMPGWPFCGSLNMYSKFLFHVYLQPLIFILHPSIKCPNPLNSWRERKKTADCVKHVQAKHTRLQTRPICLIVLIVVWESTGCVQTNNQWNEKSDYKTGLVWCFIVLQ